VFRFLLDRLSTCGLLPAPAKNENHAALSVTATGSDGLSGCSNDLLIHPGAGSRRKRWPLDRFLALGDLLFDRGLQPRFLIGPAEEDLERPLLKYGGGRYPLLRFSSLIELAAKLQSVRGFVGNDSGVAQLAGVLGVPTAAIFGPADPVRWMPLGPWVSVVRPAVDCEPCFEIQRHNCDGDRPRCLYKTQPVEVLETVWKLMADASRRCPHSPPVKPEGVV